MCSAKVAAAAPPSRATLAAAQKLDPPLLAAAKLRPRSGDGARAAVDVWCQQLVKGSSENVYERGPSSASSRTRRRPAAGSSA